MREATYRTSTSGKILYLPRWLWISTLALTGLYWLNPPWKSDALYIVQAGMTLASAILFAKRKNLVLAAALFAILFADLSYYLHTYKLQLDPNSLLAFLTTRLVYALGFFLISLSLYRQVRRGTNLFRSFKISLVPVVILVGGSLSITFSPLLSAVQDGIQYYEMGALTILSMSLPLIVISYLAIMLSFELTESCLAIGALLVGLVDWAIELEYLTAGSLAFSYLDFIWFFGLLLIFTRAMDQSEHREYVFSKGKSLRVQLKILTLLCSLLPVTAYYLSNQGDLRSGIGFLLFGTAFSLFVASIVVEYFSRQLMELTTEIQQIFNSPSNDRELADNELSEEWGESLKLVLRNKLRQDKLKADQERWLLEKRNEISAQVSHDIRSPLTALNLAISDGNNLTEQHRNLIKNAVARINDIANTLLKRDPLKSPGAAQVLLLSPLVDSVVSEKRMQFVQARETDIEADFSQTYGLFVSADPVELKRAVSNLITNAVEALPRGVGKVRVSVEGLHDEVRINIRDNGKGIPSHLLKKVGEQGFSHGKEGTSSGSGLGTHHARTTVERSGGRFEIESVEGKGTTATLAFKKAPVPSWFVDRLLVYPNSVVCSIDDDSSIHALWRGRLDSAAVAKAKIQHQAFTSTHAFQIWLETRKHSRESSQDLFLFDYEFTAQKTTGLDAIESLSLAKQSILVTSRYEETQVRQRCEELGVKLIPKTMAGFVPIEIKS